MSIKIVVICCLAAIALSASPISSLNGQFTCVSRNTTGGPCNKWNFTLGTYYNGAVCFPSKTRVMTEQGLKRMDEIQKGDKVLGYKNGKEVFTTVTSWFHKIEDAST